MYQGIDMKLKNISNFTFSMMQMASSFRLNKTVFPRQMSQVYKGHPYSNYAKPKRISSFIFKHGFPEELIKNFKEDDVEILKAYSSLITVVVTAVATVATSAFLGGAYYIYNASAEKALKEKVEREEQKQKKVEKELVEKKKVLDSIEQMYIEAGTFSKQDKVDGSLIQKIIEERDRTLHLKVLNYIQDKVLYMQFKEKNDYKKTKQFLDNLLNPTFDDIRAMNHDDYTFYKTLMDAYEKNEQVRDFFKIFSIKLENELIVLSRSESDVYRAFKKADPALLSKTDYEKYMMLQKAYENPVVKIFIDEVTPPPPSSSKSALAL